MKRSVIFILICGLLLTSCGKVDAGNSDNISGKEDVSSFSEIEADSEEEVIPDIENIQAVVRSRNILGDELQSRISAADELYSFVTEVRNNAEVTETEENEKILTVGFKAGEEEYALSYLTDNIFSWAERSGSEVTYFKPDEDKAAQLRDMMLSYSALGYVLDSNEYRVVPEHTETSYLTDLAGSLSDPYCETQYYYIDDRRNTCLVIETDGESLFYLQEISMRTDVTVGDSIYYQEEEFYEYLTDGKDKAFYRPESYDVFYPADGFEGDLEPIPLPKYIAENEEYLYSFDIESDSGELTVEVWQGDDSTDELLFRNGELSAMWSCREGEGMKLMKAFRTDEVTRGEIDEMIVHAEEHLYQPEEEQEVLPSNAKEWREYDTEKYGLFDLSGGVEIGQEVEPTGVVEEWRRYISSELEPFTLEFRWAGAERNEYEIVTFENGNYYYRKDMELHDKTRSTGHEEWLIDGRVFQTTYYTDEYDSREILEYQMDEYTDLPIELLFEDEQRGEEYAGKCERAYEVTVGGEQYICEEWSLMLDRLWKVYIKDGNIVAWEGDFYNKSTVNTVIRLEKTADRELIQIPENAKKYVSDE